MYKDKSGFIKRDIEKGKTKAKTKVVGGLELMCHIL